MDSIDEAIAHAWARLSPRLRADRAEALRRAARTSAKTLSRPVRPWCCCIRASDTRIEDLCDTDDHHKINARQPHELHLSATSLRTLCAPVSLNYPGIDWTIAARRLGRQPETLRSWINRGVFRVSHRHPQSINKRGKPVPFLWSPSPLDPSAELARAPDPVWGSLWQYLHQDIPDTAHLTATRSPCTRTDPRDAHTDAPRFRGWSFTCPGLAAPGKPNPCARATDRLFLPVPLWTIHHNFSDQFIRESREQAPTRWACHRCHHIRYFSFAQRHARHADSTTRATIASREGWNAFISHLTSGLLYGHEVEKPEDLQPTRRRMYRKSTRPSPRRDQAVALRA